MPQNKNLRFAVITVIVFAIIVFAALQTNLSTAKTVPSALDVPFSLKAGQTAVFASENLEIKFLEVTEDSRCPADVGCVWEGQATIKIAALKGSNEQQFSLSTSHSESGLGTKDFDNYSIKLEKLSPYPRAATKIPLTEYTAAMVVSRKK